MDSTVIALFNRSLKQRVDQHPHHTSLVSLNKEITARTTGAIITATIYTRKRRTPYPTKIPQVPGGVEWSTRSVVCTVKKQLILQDLGT